MFYILLAKYSKFIIKLDNPADYTYPKTGYPYAQSFLCISVPASQVNTIGLQLIYNEPEIYKFQISENLV